MVYLFYLIHQIYNSLYYIVQSQNHYIGAKFMKVPELLHAERKTYVNGKEFVSIFTSSDSLSSPRIISFKVNNSDISRL